MDWDGAVTDLYTEVDGNPVPVPNDLVFDPHAASTSPTWASSGLGGLYHARADGSGGEEIAYGFTGLNGVGLSPDGSRVYAAETVTGWVWFWNVGGPARAKLLHGFGGYQMPDSLAVDRGQRPRRDDHDRRDPPGGGAAGRGEAARAGPVRAEHLLRRAGPEHGLHHVVRARGLHATAWPCPGLRLDYADRVPR